MTRDELLDLLTTAAQLGRNESSIQTASTRGDITRLVESFMRKQIDAAPTLAPVYVRFDGPPAHESGRFVEVEMPDGRQYGHLALDWSQDGDTSYWLLGPFLVPA